MKLRSLCCLLLLPCALLAACSGDEKQTSEAPKVPPVSELYSKGESLLNQKRYAKAAEALEKVDQEYPFTDEATRAQVLAAFAHYRDGEYTDAILVTERFIKLHPAHSHTAYMYYLRAMSYYEQIADVRRDQATTQKALKALQEVARRFPHTDYARDARLKLDLVNDHLAGKEMGIGRYYLTRRRYVAAINRFQEVLHNYQTTSHVPEALYRLTEAYVALGVMQEAKKYASVLGHNYSNSKWYRRAYALMKGDIPTYHKANDHREGEAVSGDEAKAWYNIF